MTRRHALAGGGLVAVLLLAVGVMLVRAPLPPSPRGPEPGRALFQAHCAACHGAGGRGDSWRARLLFLRPGDLSRPVMATLSDQYLVELIRHGGSTFGKPGMPSFGFVLSDTEIEAVDPVRQEPGPRACGTSGGGRRRPRRSAASYFGVAGATRS